MSETVVFTTQAPSSCDNFWHWVTSLFFFGQVHSSDRNCMSAESKHEQRQRFSNKHIPDLSGLTIKTCTCHSTKWTCFVHHPGTQWLAMMMMMRRDDSRAPWSCAAKTHSSLITIQSTNSRHQPEDHNKRTRTGYWLVDCFLIHATWDTNYSLTKMLRDC